MNELNFLLELLLEHKLQKVTQDAIRARIKDVTQRTIQAQDVVPQPRPPRTAQSPSTQRILDEMASETPAPTSTEIAQTPAAAAAIAARNEAIRIAISGKEEKGRTSPRKF